MNTHKIPFIFAIFIFLVVGCSSEEICIESDLVLINTKIYTASPEQPDAEALAIKNGKFSFIGSNSEAENFNCGETKVLDLEGSFVYPGFIDAHAHLKGIGYREMNLNLQGAESLKSMLTQVLG